MVVGQGEMRTAPAAPGNSLCFSLFPSRAHSLLLLLPRLPWCVLACLCVCLCVCLSVCLSVFSIALRGWIMLLGIHESAVYLCKDAPQYLWVCIALITYCLKRQWWFTANNPSALIGRSFSGLFSSRLLCLNLYAEPTMETYVTVTSVNP